MVRVGIGEQAFGDGRTQTVMPTKIRLRVNVGATTVGGSVSPAMAGVNHGQQLRYL
jgi:hypothetical protein